MNNNRNDENENRKEVNLLKSRHAFPFVVICLLVNLLPVETFAQTGKTEITKWQDGKKTAVSITYDDGSRNQFKVALPIMERLHFPATFFIITGAIEGSAHQPKFIGRPVEQIIAETATVPTSENNFFERASASLYLGYAGALPYYNEADAFYERGNPQDAWKVMDTLYRKVRNKELPAGKDTSMEIAQEEGLSWEAVKKDAAKGYEFASHTVSHAHLAILDSANMNYELRKSKEDILQNLGPAYTFSAEVPFGIEDKRVMKFGFPIYEALRNSMPEPWMQEINRGYKEQPGQFAKEYVQWQRGPLSKTPMPLMKSWVDTSLAHDNIWLVLVFHGIEGIGWEPTPAQKLEEYFQYIQSKENDIWVATFGDVTRYVRERMNAKIKTHEGNDAITVTLTHTLNPEMYNLPLTLKTYVSPEWKQVTVKQDNKTQEVATAKDSKGSYVLYQARPNKGIITISKK
ncbi:polysaccharide deacetylase family protein [Hanamia caeni]|jgi:peptidoglycan/xylan/chitin deacetylase (PgdA/CDA1 family)|uniref:Polysaccharide deacetylase family protein n=1 Tax=Hanamia caeni TaxID=2294116 RepID=A0A3M9NI18_9BACT|nr:polysaccharide deacetylase family protein [Hanamia caeni]RNI37371.1 polysaccharide deacetylase family protein [Hanamia caeni]